MLLGTALTELRYALRTLGRSKVFAAAVVLTIAIGMGSVSAMLAMTDAAFLRKVPVAEPDRLVEIFTYDRRTPGSVGASFAELPELQRNVRGLELIASYSLGHLALGGDLAGRSVYGAFVSGDYFRIIGLRAERGRFITPGEVRPSEENPVAVISEVLWQEAFGGDDAIVGKRIRVGKSDVTVIGVAPVRFAGTHGEGRIDIWLPATIAASVGSRALTPWGGRGWGHFIGLRARDASLAEVRGGLDLTAKSLALQFPETHGSVFYRAHSGARFVGAKERLDTFAAFLMAVMIVGLIHLAACTNIVALMLARAHARRRELGVRLCLGASRIRIITHALAEPLILGVAGAAAAVLVARGITRALGSMWFLSALEPRLDLRLVAIVTMVAVLTMLQFGLVPALSASRLDPIDVVRGNARRRQGSSGRLIAAQVAVSLLLVIQAAILVSKFRTDATADPGFAAHRTLVASISMNRTAEDQQGSWKGVAEQARARLAATPGVQGVAITSSAPLRNREWTRVSRPGSDVPDAQVLVQRVSAGYFRTIEARVIQGRELESGDVVPRAAGEGEGAAVVNQKLARMYWPNASPIGERLEWNRRTFRVAGVVSDLRDGLVSRAVPMLYVPLSDGAASFSLLVVVQDDADKAAPRISGALRGTIQGASVRVESMNSIRDEALMMSRVLGQVLSACAGVALLLAALGIYGTLAMWVAERRTEIGVRMAMGARARHIYGLLLFRAGRPALIGLAVGVFLAWALVMVERASFGPTLRLDGVVTTLAAVVLVAVVWVAVMIPAHFATRTDPARVIRAEGSEA